VTVQVPRTRRRRSQRQAVGRCRSRSRLSRRGSAPGLTGVSGYVAAGRILLGRQRPAGWMRLRLGPGSCLAARALSTSPVPTGNWVPVQTCAAPVRISGCACTDCVLEM